jgi:hypothetical protein
MPEIKKVEIETESTPEPAPTLPESQMTMAVAFGQMTETNRQLMAEMATDKAERSQTSMLLTEALAELRALRSQTDSTSHRVEQLNESQTAITSAVMDGLEKEENNDVIPVTPMETHIEIDQKPVNTRKSFLQKMLFG